MSWNLEKMSDLYQLFGSLELSKLQRQEEEQCFSRPKLFYN